MANMLEDGAGFLADELIKHGSASVVVQAGGLEATVKAVKGRTELEAPDGMGGVRIITTERDYLIKRADLVLAGIVTAPQRGWRIRETVGSDVEVYEALAPADGKECWDWADEYRKVLRIHVKRVKTEF